MPHYIIEMTKEIMVADIFGPPIPFTIVRRSRPYVTRQAADHVASILSKSPRIKNVRVVIE